MVTRTREAMRYYVTIHGRTFEVELAPHGATVDGRLVDAELIAVPGTPVRHLLVDGASHTIVARAQEPRGTWDLYLDAIRTTAHVVDERTRAIRAMTGKRAGPTGPRPVRAPMPGLIVRLEVEPGQQVQPGQGIAIIEAMKMENELKAEAAGVVSRIHVSPGQAVEKGAVLVEFEAP
jgi:propionyl-CoA carboxylase alpha chain